MINSEQIISQLHDLADPDKAAWKKKNFAVTASNTLGVYHKDLDELAKGIKKNSDLAIQLFDSGIYEARILCAKVFNLKDLNEQLMEQWVSAFENWEICDSFCMGLFAKSEWAVPKVLEWADRTPEFERRASFATMAAYTMADKKASNDVFEQFLPLIEKASTDERIYVKKAVNWALRSIGKRNMDLKESALLTSEKLLKRNSKPAQWIARDAIRELEKESTRSMDYPREIYRQ